MLPYRDSRLTRTILIVFFLVVLCYAYFEARGMLFGPQIDLSESSPEASEQLYMVKGVATRIASLTINGKAIPVTETGAFEEKFLLADGLNRITLDAKDKYDRETQRIIEVAYNAPRTPTTTEMASTTSTSDTTLKTGTDAHGKPSSGTDTTGSSTDETSL